MVRLGPGVLCSTSHTESRPGGQVAGDGTMRPAVVWATGKRRCRRGAFRRRGDLPLGVVAGGPAVVWGPVSLPLSYREGEGVIPKGKGRY